MNTKYQHLKVDNYNRKSSEDKDRQVLSTPAQGVWAQEQAKRYGFKIINVICEERSAKTPYNRPEFDKMVHDIRKGLINCIICWKLDRLARNPEEAGIILGLLKRGELKLIITNDREYTTDDNAIISYVDFGMADQYVRDLSKNVKRGLRAKSQQGWRNGPAAIGYLNDLSKSKGERVIMSDPERFDLVRKILNLFLTGEYSVRQLQKETTKWGLKTRQTKRQGGRHLNVSQIYRILTEPFYCGHFFANDEYGQRVFIKGSHNAMITPEEFDLIQIKLGRKGKARPRNNLHFSYTGKIECGECSSMVTAEEKHQLICSSCKHKFAYKQKNECPKCKTKIEEMVKPKILHYTYYHCTKQKNKACTQKTLKVIDLEKLINKKMTEFKLSPEFEEWALEELAQENDMTVKSHNAIIESQQRGYKDVLVELQNLAQLYTSPKNADGSLLSLEEYEPRRKELIAEKKRLEEAQQETGRKIEEWIDWAENSFHFAVAARVWFEKGSPEERRNIFMSLSGSNLILKDDTLNVSLKKPLDFYSLIASQYPSTTITFEPTKYPANERKNLPFEADIPSLRRR